MKNLKTKDLINGVIILALLTQINHAAWVFDKISKSEGIISLLFAYIFAISLESSIFIFTMSGKKKIATFFAVVSTLLNLLYYWYGVSWSFEFVSMVIISPIIPTTIWYYSELINEREPVSRKVGRPRKTIKKN
jgi:hypothetical protein